MKNFKVKINYLYNSSFKVETENHVLIFDYYNDKTESVLKDISNGVIGKADLTTDKDIIVFATHSHGDHFNDTIFSWGEKRLGIRYVLSSDINLKENYENTNSIAPYEELNVNNVSIKAYGSTDLGISLLVEVDGINIFHAGDLNWWHWYDESDEDNIKMEKLFKIEIDKIKNEHIDLAFFPVDPRLRESYNLGPDYFITQVKPKALIPMHFREDYYITKEFADKNKEKNIRIFTVNKRGEEIIIDR
jgi:L-ascorbate metabolism protein UlaG (beta-lactamase superfamily)